jgi:glutaredoxin-like protein
MGLIGERDAKVIRDRLAKLASPVRLVVFTQEFECDYCRENRELAEELAGLSGGKVSVEVKDFVNDKERATELGIDKIPAMAVLGGDGIDHRIRFFGIPAGYEFMSLLESIDLVSRSDSGLSTASREKLKQLREPLNLQVFVTPTCPYCPRAVMLAFRMAVENPRITASMVEATEFPHLANRFQVSGVPHTVIGDSPQPMVGAYPEAAGVDMVLAAANNGNDGRNGGAD